MFSWDPNINYPNIPLLCTVSELTKRLFHEPDIDEGDRLVSGKGGWMIDYLVKTYNTNIKSAMKGKWLAMI